MAVASQPDIVVVYKQQENAVVPTQVTATSGTKNMRTSKNTKAWGRCLRRCKEKAAGVLVVIKALGAFFFFWADTSMVGWALSGGVCTFSPCLHGFSSCTSLTVDAKLTLDVSVTVNGVCVCPAQGIFWPLPWWPLRLAPATPRPWTRISSA